MQAQVHHGDGGLPRDSTDHPSLILREAARRCPPHGVDASDERSGSDHRREEHGSVLKTRQHGLIDPPIDLGLARPRGLPGLHGLLDESMSPHRNREGAELVEPCRGHVVTGRGPQRRPVRLGQVGADRIGAQRPTGLTRDAAEHLGEIEGGAQGLADGQQRLRLAEALLGLGAGVLTEPPCHQADDAHRRSLAGPVWKKLVIG